MNTAIDAVTHENVVRTPIVSFLKRRVTVAQLEGWSSRWAGFYSRGGDKSPLEIGLKFFYELAMELVQEISNSDEFDAAVALDNLGKYEQLNKYETCMICGFRALQSEYGIQGGDFNHVKFRAIRKAYQSFS